jgi:hypothetical protein
MVGEIISECRAGSNRNGGRDHSGMVGDIERNQQTGTAQTIDESKWPKDVRPIGMSEVDGLGTDSDGRLHWNGKPVEIIGRRIDLLWNRQLSRSPSVGYHDWACRNKGPSIITCPTPVS